MGERTLKPNFSNSVERTLKPHFSNTVEHILKSKFSNTLEHMLKPHFPKTVEHACKPHFLRKFSKFSISELKAVKAAAPYICSTVIEKWGMSVRSTVIEQVPMYQVVPSES